MKFIVSSGLRLVCSWISDDSSLVYWSDKIKSDFGIQCFIPQELESAHLILRQIHWILSEMGKSLVKDCRVNKIYLKNLGPNKEFYPNHGYYQGDSVTLNYDIFIHPDQPEDFYDNRGYFLTRGEETLIHEMGHAYDAVHGDLSLQTPWKVLSGWSPVPKPGLKRIIIREPGVPEVVGEWYYDPRASFTRFYAKRNPYDDWADCFSYYVGGLRSKLPENKQKYFENLLKK